MQNLQAPAPWRLLSEGLGLLELPRLLLMYPFLNQQPSGKGAPVIIAPGFGAGDQSTAVLRYCVWRITNSEKISNSPHTRFASGFGTRMAPFSRASALASIPSVGLATPLRLSDRRCRSPR